MFELKKSLVEEKTKIKWPEYWFLLLMISQINNVKYKIFQNATNEPWEYVNLLFKSQLKLCHSLQFLESYYVQESARPFEK